MHQLQFVRLLIMNQNARVQMDLLVHHLQIVKGVSNSFRLSFQTSFGTMILYDKYILSNGMTIKLHDFFQPQDQNVQLTQSVPITLHAYKRNVKTHVTPTHVVETLNVEPKTIVLSVSVFQDILEIHTVFVKNVRTHFAS